MSTQFRQFDAPSRPQVVTVKFERVEVADDYPDSSYLEQEGWEDRLAEFNRGDFHFVGIVARALVTVPIGGGSFRMFEIDSGGLYGIESDSGEDYFAEVFEDEKAALIENLKAIGEAFAEL